VAILDADKEGFLRSEISLIQTIGRAARNVNGSVIMYADKITNAIKNALSETDRRRELQITYNKKHNIIPRTIDKTISDILYSSGIKTRGKVESGSRVSEKEKRFSEGKLLEMDPSEVAKIISGLEEKMHLEARELNFESAAAIRDEIKRITKITNIEIRK
jgi:excinuclease ABC subunit B